MKAQIWVSAVIYILIMVAVIVVVLAIGTPMLNKMKYQTIASKQEEFMTTLDQHIVDVANEGQGSQRVIPFELTDGEFYVLADKLFWRLKTESKILEQRALIEKGNLVITSNA